MKKLPDAIVIVDPKKEEIAIKEARILGIPVFGVVDTNCDPDMVDYVIPGNDDAVRSVKLMIGVLTNAICEVLGKEVIDYVTEDDKAKKESKKETKKEVKEEAQTVVEETPVEEAAEETVDFSNMTLTELKEVAKLRGIKGYSKMKKEELINALN